MQYLVRLKNKASLERKDDHRVERARIIAFLFLIAALYDLITTNIGLMNGHAEGNFIVKFFQNELGGLWAVPKVAFHLMFAFFVMWLPSPKMLFIARIVIIGYALIILNNLYFIMSG